MINVTLDKEKFIRLISEKEVIIDADFKKHLGYYNDTIYHIDEYGELADLELINFQFKKREIQHIETIKEIKNMVCEHLNFDYNEVIFHSRNSEEIIFKAKIVAGTFAYIIVCDYCSAIQNCQSLDIEYNISENKEQIGLYKRLGENWYYFRWTNTL